MSMQNYCIRLKDETLKQINDLAEKKKRKTSEMLRLIIEDYCEKVNL